MRDTPWMRTDQRDRLAGISTEPVGVFRSVTSRDGNARERDGQPYYARRKVADDPRDGVIYEVLYADGEWALASAADVGLAEG
jgi:hypothetical protein